MVSKEMAHSEDWDGAWLRVCRDKKADTGQARWYRPVVPETKKARLSMLHREFKASLSNLVGPHFKIKSESGYCA